MKSYGDGCVDGFSRIQGGEGIKCLWRALKKMNILSVL